MVDVSVANSGMWVRSAREDRAQAQVLASVEEELFGGLVRICVAHLAFLCTRPLLSVVQKRLRCLL